jgi:hypothetical protein
MPVIGKHALILSHTGRVADVNPFTPDYESMRVPIVHAALKYECPYTGGTSILVVRNALHVPNMENNLIPPFMMREVGLQVRDTPKIHVKDPMEDDHAIVCYETGLRIPLSLWGVFSYFPTSKPTVDEANDSENIYLLTPTNWDPHCDSFARNEEQMLDWEGNVVDKKDRVKFMLSDIEISSSTLLQSQISSVESNVINQILADDDLERSISTMTSYHEVPRAANEVASILTEISPILDDKTLCELMHKRADLGRYQSAIGSTNASSSQYLFDTLSAVENELPRTDDEGALIDWLHEGAVNGTLDLDAVMASSAHARQSRGVDAEHLSKVWRVDIDTAREVVGTTTQHNTRTEHPTLSRNYGTNDKMLRYKRINEYFYMDTFFATSKAGKSSRGNTCCQLFVTDKGFVHCIPMKTRSEVEQAVKQFAKEIGAPDAIVCDASGEQTKKSLKRFLSEIGTTLRILEEGTPWTNKAELYIGLIKEAVRKDMKASNCPLAFWDYCVERRVRINNLTPKRMFSLHGQSPHTSLHGEEGDISNLCQYGWYEWCYYREQKEKFPFNAEVLGRVLGPAKGEGNEMCQWILKANGFVVPRKTLRPLRVEEIHSDIEKRKREVFDQLTERRWGTSMSKPPPEHDPVDQDNDLEEYQSEDEPPRIVPDIEDVVDNKGKLLNQQPAYDKLLNAEVALQLDEQTSIGKVTRRALNPDGHVVGSYDENPFLNSIVYEVEFPDGQVKEYAANVIAENMLSQVDADGYSLHLLDSVIDHRSDPDKAITRENMYVIDNHGTRKMRKTTMGWSLLVKWKDNSESWIPLKDMKESHPVETAEYARARGIADEPAFRWWVPYTLRKRDVILAKVKARVRKSTHKYGIEIPTSVAHAMEIDKRNCNTLWQDALKREMTNIGIAFEVLPDGEPAPVGWNKVTGHLIWDVKMDFTRKARWVLDGHKTPDAKISTYAGVVSRDSVRIAFTYAALNNLEVCAADICNAYLQAPSSRKDYIVCGPEFGLENVGKVALIHRALYGGKTARRDFRNHLRSCMGHLDFKSCPADPDVWMRPARHSDGTEHYEYVLLYTDDALVVGEFPERILREEIGKYFTLKDKSVGPPKIYLGGHVRKVTLENGVKCWSFSPSQYIQAAVKNVEECLARPGNEHLKMPRRAETPLPHSYRPELDVSPVLSPTEAAYYQSLVGMLRWMVELGRVDICLEVSMMASHLAMPREGHLNHVLNIFTHLKKYHNTELVYDPSDPVVNESDFERKDWTASEFGMIDGKEEMPPNMPEPRGQGFTISAKVDADHAADSVTRRSRTGFLVFINSALVYWLSKKQTSVESSSFGSEFIAMKQCCEYIRGLRYKLRMLGIPCDGPAYVYGDNQSVLANTSIPDSTLKKKSQSIAYHMIREGAARDEWRTAYVNTSVNEADLLTKLLPNGARRRGFVMNLLHHIYRGGTESVE